MVRKMTSTIMVTGLIHRAPTSRHLTNTYIYYSQVTCESLALLLRAAVAAAAVPVPAVLERCTLWSLKSTRAPGSKEPGFLVQLQLPWRPASPSGVSGGSGRGGGHLLNKRTENPQRFPHGMSLKELQYSTLVK